jgi:hypothetical protein
LVAKLKGSVMLPRPSLTLDDLLADSLIQTVMQADRVEPEAVRALMDGAARRLAAESVAFEAGNVRHARF